MDVMYGCVCVWMDGWMDGSLSVCMDVISHFILFVVVPRTD